MARRVRLRTLCVVGAVVAAVAAACSNGTQPVPVCPTYTGGNVPGTSMAGSYSISSICIGAPPDLQGDTGTLRLWPTSATAGSYWVELYVGPIALLPDTVDTGTYTISGSTINQASVKPKGPQFSGTFLFRGDTRDTLSLSGVVSSVSEALVFVHQ